jgi:hypothetical protein
MACRHHTSSTSSRISWPLHPAPTLASRARAYGDGPFYGLARKHLCDETFII